MPHLITNRPRQHNIFSHRPAGHLHASWETANAILYLIGGVTFIIGSVFFLPAYEKQIAIGLWLYIIGSLIYMTVTGHDLIEACKHYKQESKIGTKDKLELLASAIYCLGTLLFLMGSVLFAPTIGAYTWVVWMFIVGSILFILGASINVIQAVQAGSPITLQPLNTTAITFVVGSTLF